MPRFCTVCSQFLLAGMLAGCGTTEALQVSYMVLHLPNFTESGKVKLQGYSLGPVSSPEFPELLQAAIPYSEGDVLLAGHASWSGLFNVSQPGYRTHQTVAAMTRTRFLFLWWNKEEERYKTLMRFPYDDIQWISTADPESGKPIQLCHKFKTLAVADETVSVGQLTRFGFLESNYSQDPEKTKMAFDLLDERIPREEDFDPESRACESVYDSDYEHVGFGQEDPSIPD